MANDTKQLTLKIKADVEQARRDMAAMRGDFGKFGSSADRRANDLSSAGTALRNFLGIFGVGIGIGQIANFIKSSIDLADTIHDLSLRSGIAVETLAGLDLVAKKTGTTLEGLATANKKLSAFVAEADFGNKEHQKTLAALGITARAPTERLYQMADAIRAIEDPTLRQAIALKVMGK